MSLVEQRKFNPSTDVMDEIPRTYYPGRGFLSDQEAYPTDLYGNVRPPNLHKTSFIYKIISITS